MLGILYLPLKMLSHKSLNGKNVAYHWLGNIDWYAMLLDKRPRERKRIAEILISSIVIEPYFLNKNIVSTYL